MLLQRVVCLTRRGLRPEEEIMFDHRPYSRKIPASKQNLSIISAEELIPEIDQPGRDVNPHERQVPLQRAAEPSANGERLRPVQQILLRNLGAKAGERAKYLQPAARHHKQRNRI